MNTPDPARFRTLNYARLSELERLRANCQAVLDADQTLVPAKLSDSARETIEAIEAEMARRTASVETSSIDDIAKAIPHY